MKILLWDEEGTGEERVKVKVRRVVSKRMVEEVRRVIEERLLPSLVVALGRLKVEDIRDRG